MLSPLSCLPLGSPVGIGLHLCVLAHKWLKVVGSVWVLLAAERLSQFTSLSGSQFPYLKSKDDETHLARIKYGFKGLMNED